MAVIDKEPSFTSGLSAARWCDGEYFANAPRKLGLLRLFMAQMGPDRGRMLWPTFPGVVIVAVNCALLMASYNSGHNILFLCVSLLTSVIAAGALLAYGNTMGLEWRLLPPRAFEAEACGRLVVQVRNRRRLLPALGLVARVEVPGGPKGGDQVPVSFVESGGGVGEGAWLHTPARRGMLRISLGALQTQFPFGFFRATLRGLSTIEVPVWPKPLPYDLRLAAHAASLSGEATVQRLGVGGETLGLRAYRPGDPPRLIHWKVSARVGSLVTRETAAESVLRYALDLEPGPGEWTDKSLDCLCGVALKLAMDLHAQGQLAAYRCRGNWRVLSDASDFDRLRDDLAALDAGPSRGARPQPPRACVVLGFAPNGKGGVSIHANGRTLGGSRD